MLAMTHGLSTEYTDRILTNCCSLWGPDHNNACGLDMCDVLSWSCFKTGNQAHGRVVHWLEGRCFADQKVAGSNPWDSPMMVMRPSNHWMIPSPTAACRSKILNLKLLLVPCMALLGECGKCCKVLWVLSRLEMQVHLSWLIILSNTSPEDKVDFFIVDLQSIAIAVYKSN